MPHLHNSAIEMMKVGWTEVRGLDQTLADIGILEAQRLSAVRFSDAA